MRLAAHAVLALSAALLLTACNGQRPLHVLHDDAQIAAKARNYEKARADFEEYLNRRPDDPAIRYELSQVCMGQGDYKEAVRQLTIASDVQPLNTKYIDGLAEAMFQAGEKDTLTNYLARLSRERAGVADYNRQGVYAAKLGNVDEAQQAFLTAAKLDQGMNVGPQLALSDFYGSLGDRDKQVTRLRMAYYIDQANPGVIERAHALGETLGPAFMRFPAERQ